MMSPGPQQRAAVVRGAVHPVAPGLRVPGPLAARRHGRARTLRTDTLHFIMFTRNCLNTTVGVNFYFEVYF